jgi:hypothetical protein
MALITGLSLPGLGKGLYRATLSWVDRCLSPRLREEVRRALEGLAPPPQSSMMTRQVVVASE